MPVFKIGSSSSGMTSGVGQLASEFTPERLTEQSGDGHRKNRAKPAEEPATNVM